MRSRIFVSTLLVFLVAPSLVSAQKQVLVKANTLTLRAKPSVKSKALTSLITYQPVRVLERKGKDWTRIQVKDKKGWVLSRYLTQTGFVWVDHTKVNVRRGPGTEYARIMNYGKYFPMYVLDVARNGWLKVMDFDGDRGWVHPNLIKHEPHYVITKLDECNIRQGVGTGQEIAFTATRGVIFQVLDEKEGWLRVRHADGDEGWLSAKIVFGWRDEKAPDKKA